MSETRHIRKRGTVPGYWWDFDGSDLIVETDDPRVPSGVVDRIAYQNPDSCDKIAAIVADWQAGRRRAPTAKGEDDGTAG